MTLHKGDEVKITIESAAFKGKGIAKIDRLAVFVPNTASGDRVKVKITKKKRNYCEGRLLEIISAGPHRITSRCRHAQECGGCSWQHVSYEHQLEFKRDQVDNHMQRIGNFSDLNINDTIGCENIFYYRNKMEYSIGSQRWLSQEEIDRDEFVNNRCFAAGLHAPGRFDRILNIQECHLQDPVSYKILNFVRNWCIKHEVAPYDPIQHIGFMRNVVIRKAFYTDDLMVNLVTYKDDEKRIQQLSDALLDTFTAITTITNNINDQKGPTAVGRYEKVIFGPGFITDHIGNYHFRIDANAFFQTNTLQAERLYQVVRDFADIQQNDVIYDLYCGVGTLSLFLSKKARKVIGIELAEVAIKNARKNAEENEVTNTTFVNGDMQKVFTDSMVHEYEKPNCLITDPPRAGMHPDVVQQLNALKVPKIIYISCDSSTMARDLKILSKVYDVLEVQPLDMFPQTYHIETVAKLKLKEEMAN